MDNSVLGNATESDANDVEDAISAAREAFDNGPWPQMRAAGARVVSFFKLADLIDKNAEDVTPVTRREITGSRCARQEFDVADAAGCFRYYAGLITKSLGQTL